MMYGSGTSNKELETKNKQLKETIRQLKNCDFRILQNDFINTKISIIETRNCQIIEGHKCKIVTKGIHAVMPNI